MVLREWIFIADLPIITCLISFTSNHGYSCQSKCIGRWLRATYSEKLYLEQSIKQLLLRKTC